MIEGGGRVKNIAVTGDGEPHEDTTPHGDTGTPARGPGDPITGIKTGQVIARSRQLDPVRNDKLRARRGGVDRIAVGCFSVLEDDLV